MKRGLGILLMLLLGSGCATVPFRPVVPVSPGDVDPEVWRQAVADTLPERFTVTGSVVFHYRGRALTALSVTEVDEPGRFFSVVAVSPVGMTLFDIACRAGQIEHAVLAPGMESRGDPSKTIAKDIERVYFNRVPPATSMVRRQSSGFLFMETTPDGKWEYQVGGSPPVLVEKRFRDEHGTVWTATYYEYQEHDGKQYPGGIVYRHRRYGYRIDLRLTEVLAEAPENGNDK